MLSNSSSTVNLLTNAIATKISMHKPLATLVLLSLLSGSSSAYCQSPNTLTHNVTSLKKAGTIRLSAKPAESNEKAPGSSSKETEAKLDEALKHIRDIKYAPAKKLIDEVMTKEPNNPRALALKARNHLDLFQTGKEAAAEADKAIKLAPNASDGYTARVRVTHIRLCYGDLQNLKKEDKAKYEQQMFADAKKAISLNPKDPDTYIELALYYQNPLKDLKRSLDYLNKAVEADPTSNTAYFQLAHLHFKMDNYRAAMEDFKTLAKVNPAEREWCEGQIEHCKQSLGAQEKLEKAEREIQTKQTADAYFQRAEARTDINSKNSDGIKQAQVIEDCTRAIALDSKMAKAYALRAYMQSIGPNQQDAKADLDYQKAVSLAGTNPALLAAYASFLINQHKYPQAIELYTKVLATTKHADVYSMRAKAYSSARQFDKAVADATEAIKMDAKSGFAYYQRGLAYMGLKKFELADADKKMAQSLGMSTSPCSFCGDPWDKKNYAN